MQGGKRSGAGRKSLEECNRRKGIPVYFTEQERELISEFYIPDCNNFSKKCVYLIKEGINSMVNNKNNDTKEASSDTVKYIDLFAGLGGIRIGFEQALKEKNLKGMSVFSSEVKKAALKAYNHNFNEDAFVDITQVDPKEIPDFDYLLAGFPCQAFSQAGKGRGFEDTRGTLFFNVANILKIKKPKGFILENVEGLVIHDKGKTLETIINSLHELEYSVSYKVLDSKDFGLAQSRKRIYIVGRKYGEEVDLENFTPYSAKLADVLDYDVDPQHTDFTNKLLEHYELDQLYGKSIKDKRGGENNIHSWDIELKGAVSSEQKDLLEKLLRQRRNKKWAEIIGIDWMDGMPLTKDMIQTFFEHDDLQAMLDDLVEKGYLKFEYPKKKVGRERVPDETLPKGYNIVTGKLSFEFSKILDPNDVTPTIVATDVSKLAVPINGGLRKLTVSEGLRLFGFPSDYNLSCLKEREAFDLLGNTVCVPVIKEISMRLLEI